MVKGRCLCGDHRFRLDGDLVFMHDCHCGFCRKFHGSAFSTMIGVVEAGLQWDAKGDQISFESSKGFTRSACRRCGSPLPCGGDDAPVFVPTGLLEGDFGHRSEAQIFVASKLSWLPLRDGVPDFDTYPPGIDAPVWESRPALDPPGGVRGSCLCGEVRFVIQGAAIAARHCHCVRCQQARGAAHASNLILEERSIRFTSGTELLRTYRVQGAKFFAQCFCGRCGSTMPRVDESRGIAIVPIGCLDDSSPLAPSEHIWVESKAVWHEIADDLPQFAQGPPS